jgi:hypothetical protein
VLARKIGDASVFICLLAELTYDGMVSTRSPTPCRSVTMISTSSQLDPAMTGPAYSLREWGCGVLHMTLLWLGFGAVVGTLTAPPEGGIVRVIAGTVAGMIVLPFMGAFLGMIGGKWRETFWGGVAGLLLGAIVGIATGQTAWLHIANVGLIGGGLVGATFFSFLSHVRRVVAVIR